MKLLIALGFVATLASCVLATPIAFPAFNGHQGFASNAMPGWELTRVKKSAPGYGAPAPSPSYGGAPAAAPSYAPSVPCPKNYLFSCNPNLAPVPCQSEPAGYSPAGAYSENIPTYLMPQPNIMPPTWNAPAAPARAFPFYGY